MSFKTTEEIWDALKAGNRIQVDYKGNRVDYNFAYPEDWIIYEEPKGKPTLENLEVLENFKLFCITLPDGIVQEAYRLDGWIIAV